MELLQPPAKRFREAGSDLKASELSIESVIAVAELGRPLDTKSMEKMYKDLEKKGIDFKFADRFQGVVLKKQTPEGLVTGNVFPSGRIVCTGAKTELAARAAATGMLEVIKQITYQNKSASTLPVSEIPKIQGYVGSYDTGFEVQLELLAFAHPEEAVYEPEIYPSLIYKPKNIKATVFVSPKGNVQISASSQDLMNEAQKAMRNILARYQRSKFGRGS